LYFWANILMKTWHKISLLPALFLLLASSCETNRGELIPVVTVNINLTLYGDLATLGPEQYLLLSGGVNGIILYRNSVDQYFAFDRTCTLWPEHDEAVEPDDTFDGVFVCPECGSKYLLLNEGQAYEGEAVYSLVQYRTYIEGNILHIYN